MEVVKILLKDYCTSQGHIVVLVEEFYGRGLTNDEDEGSMEFGFETRDGMKDVDLAAEFKRTLNDGFGTFEARARWAEEKKNSS